MILICDHCLQKELVSASEIKIGVCMDCVPSIVKELALAKLRENQATVERDRATASENDIKDKWTARLLLEQAEKHGATAAERGASLDDNPYHKDADESACWSHGWIQRNMSMEVAKMQAVMVWAINNVDIIRQLLRGGCSQEEAASKLDNVVEKVFPYIQEEDTQEAT